MPPSQFGGVYRGKRILVTGHTGFKGSWLTLWLSEVLGAEVSGISLPPPEFPNHWKLLGLKIDDRQFDIRNGEQIAKAIAEIRPEIVFHLAAQPLVRASYADPIGTWATNVMGTANVLDACRQCNSVRAIVAVTTDKCYENLEHGEGFKETDRLGGHDPYSASKAGAEMVAASYRSAFFNPPKGPLLATARAGNVIGGGDWSRDRLIPDLVRSVESKQPLLIRSPKATRPWQHVLESLTGYLLLGQKLNEGDASFAEAWNFGPSSDGNRPVQDVLERLKRHWPDLKWDLAPGIHPHEAGLLHLDSTKARTRLGWHPVWDLDQALATTADWYRTYLATGEIATRPQLQSYCAAACKEGGAHGPHAL
ncbi:MAG TPA: CDP-glucose 4,6-dehydratase [Opitutaceae bacterium]|jgi:CDP-glucose 4,6-dehydratase